MLAAVRTSALSDMLQFLKTKDPNSPPEASARVAVPVPRALRELVADSAAQPHVQPEHRDNLIRLLLCGQWPALDPNRLNLHPHEAAALTWCAKPSVWALKHTDLDKLPAKRKRRHPHLDSICPVPSWKLVCARCAAYCASVFDAVASAILQQHSVGTDGHEDMRILVSCSNG